MSSSLSHLHPRAAEMLTWTKDARIAVCRKDMWVGYPGAHAILDRMERIYTYPKSLCMPNLLVLGEANNGKTSILERFAKKRQVQTGEDSEHQTCVLRILMPRSPTASSFWSEILWAMAIAHRDDDPPARKRRQAYEVMQHLLVRALAIDGFNHLSDAGKHVPKLLAAMKHLVSTLRIPIIAMGTDKCLNALNSDLQIKSRFQIVPLEPWRPSADYQRFLRTYESMLPLALPSNLAEPELCAQIYAMGGRAIGGTVSLLKLAAEHAIASGMERIDAKLLASLSLARPGARPLDNQSSQTPGRIANQLPAPING